MKLNLSCFSEIAERYLEALSKADLKVISSLFTSDAQIFSPLYGRQDVHKFYGKLFADTMNSVLTLKDTSINTQNNSGCIFFEYAWTMANGEMVRFDVVDYVKLNEEGKINFLQIVYDTVQARPAWEKPSTAGKGK